MPLREVADTNYYLVLFDEDGNERTESTGEKLSVALLDHASRDVTDIFILSHGWKGDIPAAIRQYDAWIGSMASQVADRDRFRSLVPDFSALVVGVHWPSLPFGVEDEESALLGEVEELDEFAAESRLPDDVVVDLYAQRIGDTAATRDALATIVAATEDPDMESLLAGGQLPEELRAAYETLFAEAGLGLDGALGAPGDDQATFDPATTIVDWSADWQAEAGSEGLVLGWQDDLGDRLAAIKKIILSPVRQLSFWSMKRRARSVGSSGVHDLLKAIQQSAPNARVHLMGHSFGCILVSAAIAGPMGPTSPGLSRPVDSVFLVQGAMSLWSYAERVLFPPFLPGYFRPLLEPPGRVRGPLVTTRSTFDTAVGRLYPLGARVGGDLLLGDDLPEFGAIGTFGIQGTDAVDIEVLSATSDYDLAPGQVYNVEASSVINSGSGASGAHNDIAHPEIAHLMWQAALSTVPG